MDALGLDIKLLLAQIINFLLLWFLLSKFVYKPVLKLLDDRKKKIATSLTNAKKIEDKLVEIEAKEKAILKSATTKAIQEEKEIIFSAKKERSAIVEAARLDAQKEAQKAIDRIHAEEIGVYERIKEKLVADIADETAKRLSNNAKFDQFPLLTKLLNE